MSGFCSQSKVPSEQSQEPTELEFAMKWQDQNLIGILKNKGVISLLEALVFVSKLHFDGCIVLIFLEENLKQNLCLQGKDGSEKSVKHKS